ncbi:hypothetical protein PC128_g24918 [Phytophthora cactorum]|nr:hypothetical protein PC121_g20937 [Phytophthora cactorum]KAG3141785.1 hypothetical protein PC128_g24918 [Phytophthora cactorum]KAG4044050.1 hypothetical protein PC123_g20489 [Phytophthora cactorum]
MFRPVDGVKRYLENLEDLRRKLANMNATISGGEVANGILQGMKATHQNAVRRFSSPSRVGAGNLEPDFDVVLNTLRGKAEMPESIVHHVKSDDQRPVKAMKAKPCDKQQPKKKPPTSDSCGL